MLCGGGRVTYYLARQLHKLGIKIHIIEEDLDRCRELNAMVPGAQIVHGDCSDLDMLESEGIADCDALVTLTGRDELNMILSLYGTGQGVPQVITKMSEVGNRHITDELNLGSVVCPKELCCNTIIRYVRAMQNQTGAAVSVHAIADGQVEAMEFLVDENTNHCGIPLKNLSPKPNVLVASITHGSVTEIPNGDSMFHKGDTVVIVTSGQNTVRQLNDIFA